MLTIHRSSLYILFLITVLVTEYYYIEVGGGVAHLYHFLAVPVVLLSVRRWNRLFSSPIWLVLVAFAFVNVLAASLSSNPARAFASLLSLIANFGVSAAIALALWRNSLTTELLVKWVTRITMISVVWGLFQIAAGQFGLVLALSPEQESQILIGFGPGFRTEANTFGKYLLFPFLLCLPVYLRGHASREMKFAYLLMIIGILMNFTRTAVYGLTVGVSFALAWYFGRLRLFPLLRRISIPLVLVAFGIALIATNLIQISAYATFKIERFFDRDELLSGQSSGYRLEAMQTVIDQTVNSTKRLIIGNGWGQTFSSEEVRTNQVADKQAGGGDLVNIFGYAGMVGVLVYVFLAASTYYQLSRAAKLAADTPSTCFAEGLLFAFVGMFFTGQMSGYLIAPEYWLLLGACIFVSGSAVRRPTVSG